MSYAPYLLIAAAVAVCAVIVSWRIDAHSHEVVAVNSWFADRMLLFPPQPLPPPEDAMIRDLMGEDDDLWWHLNHDHKGEDGKTKALDREPYYQKATAYGRYLHVLDAACKPALFYGLFEDGDEMVFRVWIEFHYQGGTVWVLSGDDYPGITRLSDFRVYHPGLIHRRFIALR